MERGSWQATVLGIAKSWMWPGTHACVPISHPSWTSLLPHLHPTPLGHHRAPSWVPCAIQPVTTSCLFCTWKFELLFFPGMRCLPLDWRWLTKARVTCSGFTTSSDFPVPTAGLLVPAMCSPSVEIFLLPQPFQLMLLPRHDFVSVVGLPFIVHIFPTRLDFLSGSQFLSLPPSPLKCLSLALGPHYSQVACLLAESEFTVYFHPCINEPGFLTCKIRRLD